MADGYQDQLLDLIAARVIAVDDVNVVVLRSLNSTDAHGTLGLSVDDWAPLEYEMGGPVPYEPSVQRYNLSLQHIVKWAKQEEGERKHREVAKAIRLMLYRDTDFQVSLRSLFVQENSRREGTRRFYITDQRYAQNLAAGVFLYMSVTGLAIETEVRTTS